MIMLTYSAFLYSP